MKTMIDRIPAPPKVKRLLKIGEILSHDMQRCDLFKHASAMAYVTLFSLVPSLAATFALISLFKPFLGKDSSLLMQAKSFILQNLATGAGEQLVSFLDNFITNLDMTKIGLTGFAGLLFTLVMLLRQVEVALNRIWLVTQPRHMITRFIYFWTFITLGTLVIGLSFGIVSGFNLQRMNPFGKTTLTVGQEILSVITPSFMTFLFFTLLYKIVPNTYVNLRHAAMGALPAAVLFTLAGASYSWFAPNFTSYKAIYGALAAVPLFLMWLYILWLITLFGALLAWRAEQSFDIKDDMDQQSPYLTVQERVRNNQLQGMIPYVCMVVIHQVYEEGTGQGINGLEISHQLNIPAPWISESLEFLLALGLIVATQKDGTERHDIMQSHYFPAQPSSKLTERDLMEKIYHGCDEWVLDWKHQWSPDLKPLLERTLRNLRSIEQRSLAQVVKGD